MHKNSVILTEHVFIDTGNATAISLNLTFRSSKETSDRCFRMT